MPHISIAEARNRMQSDVQFLDVREDDEVATGTIPGAKHIPLGILGGRLLELDRSRPIIAVCRSGNRSAKATQLLEAAGFRVDNMSGGMMAWIEAGLPVSR